MRKKVIRRSAPAPARLNYGRLVRAIASAHVGMQGRAVAAVNQALVLRNWLIGAHLVEYEQGGADRAKYGARLLERLSKDLAEQGVKGLGVSILERCRLAFLFYPQLAGAISETVCTELSLPLLIPYTLPTESGRAKRQTVSAESSTAGLLPAIRGTVSPELVSPLSPHLVLRFSWSKLQEFIRLDDPLKRAFYENECLQGNWSVRQLKRQIETLLYERTGLSTNKRAVIARARTQVVEAPAETVEEMIRDPYVLEFAGLAERAEYSENELETALLDHLQRFLLELGTGFCFEARQFRVTVNHKHDRIDLVFYHRRLRCHVLIDLKIRAFRHTDAGQIHPVRYVNDYEPILLRLCPPKSERPRILHGLHRRFETPRCGAHRRHGCFHEKPPPRRACLLRGLPKSAGCHSARKVSQNILGETIHQDPDRSLSNGVNFYLNWFKAKMTAPGDQPPVGILLCSDKDGTEVEFATAGMDNKLFVSRYLTALPSAAQLKALVDADRARIEAHTKPGRKR